MIVRMMSGGKRGRGMCIVVFLVSGARRLNCALSGCAARQSSGHTHKFVGC